MRVEIPPTHRLARLARAGEDDEQLLTPRGRIAAELGHRQRAHPSAPVGTSAGTVNWLNGTAAA